MFAGWLQSVMPKASKPTSDGQWQTSIAPQDANLHTGQLHRLLQRHVQVLTACAATEWVAHEK
jgi:hypothetical protein